MQDFSFNGLPLVSPNFSSGRGRIAVLKLKQSYGKLNDRALNSKLWPLNSNDRALNSKLWLLNLNDRALTSKLWPLISKLQPLNSKLRPLTSNEPVVKQSYRAFCSKLRLLNSKRRPLKGTCWRYIKKSGIDKGKRHSSDIIAYVCKIMLWACWWSNCCACPYLQLDLWFTPNVCRNRLLFIAWCL